MEKELENKSADKLLNEIVLKTMTRYNDLTESEYLEKLGVNLEKYPNLNENKVNDIAIINMLLAMQRRLLKLQTDLAIICANVDAKSKIETKKNKKRKH